MLPEFSLEGKKAFVTGAGRGIGKSIAVAFAEAGAEVTLVARTEEQLKASRDEIRDMGCSAHYQIADVMDRVQIRAAVAGAMEDMGDLDIIMNSAGAAMLKPIVYMGQKYPGWENAIPEYLSDWGSNVLDEDIEWMFNANCRSIVYTAREAGPVLLKKGAGTIISVISCYYDVAPPYHMASCVSKAAAHMLTRCLATEFAHFGVTVNAIAPGNVDTELNEFALSNPDYAKYLEPIPLQRAAQPREIAAAATFLASGAASFMTGETMVVDGGELSRGLGL